MEKVIVYPSKEVIEALDLSLPTVVEMVIWINAKWNLSLQIEDIVNLSAEDIAHKICVILIQREIAEAAME